MGVPLGSDPELETCLLHEKCSWEEASRKGIMGHVIILCEALVNAYNYFDPKFEKTNEDKNTVLSKSALSHKQTFVCDSKTEVEDDGDWSRKRKDPPSANACDNEQDITRCRHNGIIV